jgi:hydrogenase/urease accessory protein HupE
MRRVVLTILVAFGVVVALAWGVTAAVTYAVIAVFLALIVTGVAIGGDLVQRVSRSRFEYHDRR